MTQTWVCPECGLKIEGESITLPIYHQCGAYVRADYAGVIITDKELAAPSRGLGDTIAKVTKFFSVDPCGGCEERQKVLNEMFPYSPEYLAEQAKRASNG